jgi:hypothetical protein
VQVAFPRSGPVYLMGATTTRQCSRPAGGQFRSLRCSVLASDPAAFWDTPLAVPYCDLQ